MTQTTNTTQNKEELERCGYCGRWFIGERYLLQEEIVNFTKEQLDNAPLGYGPDAQKEHYEQNPDDTPSQYNSDDFPF